MTPPIEPLTRRRTLRDSAGVNHLALAPNDASAWWTPIACGEGITLPGSQTAEPVDCPGCLAYQRARVEAGE